MQSPARSAREGPAKLDRILLGRTIRKEAHRLTVCRGTETGPSYLAGDALERRQRLRECPINVGGPRLARTPSRLRHPFDLHVAPGAPLRRVHLSAKNAQPGEGYRVRSAWCDGQRPKTSPLPARCASERMSSGNAGSAVMSIWWLILGRPPTRCTPRRRTDWSRGAGGFASPGAWRPHRFAIRSGSPRTSQKPLMRLDIRGREAPPATAQRRSDQPLETAWNSTRLARTTPADLELAMPDAHLPPSPSITRDRARASRQIEQSSRAQSPRGTSVIGRSRLSSNGPSAVLRCDGRSSCDLGPIHGTRCGRRKAGGDDRG